MYFLYAHGPGLSSVVPGPIASYKLIKHLHFNYVRSEATGDT